MTPSKKKLKMVTGIIFLISVIFAGYFILHNENPNAADSASISDQFDVTTSSENAPIKVEADSARMGELVMQLATTGLTRAVREVSISPKVGGQVVRLAVAEGQFVQKGDLLLKLDDRELRLALADAKDKLVGAQAEFRLRWHADILGTEAGTNLLTDSQNRVSNGGNTPTNGLVDLQAAKSHWQTALQQFKNGELSEEAFLEATLAFETARILSGQKRQELVAHKTGLTQAVLAVQRAELNLSYTEIHAPFSGQVADVEVAQGQQVTAGKACLKLVDLSQIDVDLQVLESEIGLIKPGRQAEVTFPAYPDEVFNGRVASINPLVDTENKSVRVTVRLDNPDQRILPGMFSYAKLDAQIFKDRFIVPKDAILIRDQRKLVFIVRDGLAKWCYVETGLENEEFVEILDSKFGLKPGEMVITSGHYTLVHDARVRY